MNSKTLMLEPRFFQSVLRTNKVCACRRKDEEGCSQPKILSSLARIPQVIPPAAHKQGPFFRGGLCSLTAPLSSSRSPCVAGQGVIPVIETQLHFLQGLSVLRSHCNAHASISQLSASVFSWLLF